MNAITIVEKAWYHNGARIFGLNDYEAGMDICRGETLGKAKYKLFSQLQDLGYDISFKEVCTDVKFRRFPLEDLVKVPAAPVLESLTIKQRHIIGHSNGNNSDKPGYRDYYCAEDGDVDCEHLVSLGLMYRGRALESTPPSRYYILTKSGALAALSDAVLPRHRSEEIFIPSTPALIDRGDFLDLESIKANPELESRFSELKCRIFSHQWGYYWREKACGYGKKSEAGIYTFKDALKRTHHCGPEKGIWFELISDNDIEVAA